MFKCSGSECECSVNYKRNNVIKLIKIKRVNLNKLTLFCIIRFNVLITVCVNLISENIYEIIFLRKDVCFKMIILNNSIRNKRFFVILAIFITSICSSPPFTTKHIFIGGDTLYHILRVEELSKNILNGNFFPYIHSGALGGYGYASAFFYPELTLIIPAIFHILGFDTLISINISSVIYNAIAGIIMYYCLKIYLNDVLNKEDDEAWLSLIGAIAYIAYPYRLYNLFYRVALNEYIAMCFIPLALLSMYKIFFKKEFKYWKMLSISFSLCLLTHLITTLILSIVGIIFFVANIKLITNKEFIKSVSKAILCSILATSYFLFPMIEQMLSNEFFYTTLQTLDDVKLYPNQTIEKRAAILVGDSISQPLLILLNMLIILTMILISKKVFKKTKRKPTMVTINSMLVFVYIFIMQTDIFPWKTVIEIFPVILKIQFPFRFFVLMGVAYSLIIVLTIPKNKHNMFTKIVIIILIIVSPKLIIKEKSVERESLPEEILKTIDTSWYLGFGEYLPSKIEFNYIEYLYKRGNVVNIKYKNGTKISVERELTKKHTNYTVDNSNGDVEYIEMPLIYYKGYTLKNNATNMQLEESDDGFVKIKNIPKEKIDIEVYYKGTIIQSTSNVTTLIFLFSIILFKKINKRKECYHEKVVFD